MKRVFKLANHEVRQRAAMFCWEIPTDCVVTFSEPTRSLDQNSRLWALLADISKQVQWYGRYLTPEDWKHVFTASLRRLDVVPNLDGTGFVAIGMSTSRMSKRQLSDLMELISAFGAERGVVWSEPERSMA